MFRMSATAPCTLQIVGPGYKLSNQIPVTRRERRIRSLHLQCLLRSCAPAGAAVTRVPVGSCAGSARAERQYRGDTLTTRPALLEVYPWNRTVSVTISELIGRRK